MLSLVLLGAPRLERDGKLVQADTRKALALAAYLALTDAAHSRDELAALFYPDATAARARGALRRTLSALKGALGDQALEIDRDSIRLEPGSLRVDVLEFSRLAETAAGAPDERVRLVQAARLYRGDFLTGFTLRDSPAFDEWQFFETESLRKQLAGALERLVALEWAHNLKSAIEYARRWLALDPLHEPAHRALMQLYAASGQRAAALRQYQECVRLLDDELGVAPLPETTELYTAILENRFKPTARGTALEPQVAHETARAPVAAAAFPMVGRAAELALLNRAYDAVRDQGVLLAIQGEAGIGKSRLAEEFIKPRADAGAQVLSARVYAEQRALAFAPITAALRAALLRPETAAQVAALAPAVRADAARLLPELDPSGGGALGEGVGSQARFFEALTQVILACTRNHLPGILYLDDAQWLDDASLELVVYLIRRLRAAPLCVLMTWRTQEMPTEHPLRRVYADALRQERAHLISLNRLDRAQVSTLVKLAAERGAPIDAALGERLAIESEGQPFFLVEALKIIEQEGKLPDGDGLPASVRELLHSRLAHISETARQILGAAVVIGRAFDFETVRQASGRSEEETIVGLEELVAQGLVVESSSAGEPQYDFTHDKLRALVYDELSLGRRRLLHRRTAEALAQSARGGQAALARAGQIAQHYRLGGAEALAADYYKRAGDYARTVLANREAVEDYTAALALGHPDAALLHRSIGDARTLLGEYDAALAAYQTSAAMGGSDLAARMVQVYLRRGDWEHAARELREQLRTVREPAARANLFADLALARHQAGDAAQAAKDAQQALRLATRAGDTRALARAHNILGILARTEGDLHAAHKHLEQSVTMARQLGDGGMLAAALNNLALVSFALGEQARAVDLTTEALGLAVREGDRHREAALHNHLADLNHAQGRAADSMAHLKQAVAIYAEIGGEAGEWQPEIWKLEEW